MHWSEYFAYVNSFNNLIVMATSGDSTISRIVLQMSELGKKKVKWHAQGHTAGRT